MQVSLKLSTSTSFQRLRGGSVYSNESNTASKVINKVLATRPSCIIDGTPVAYQHTGGGHLQYSLRDLVNLVKEGRLPFLERVGHSDLKPEAREEFFKAINVAKKMVKKGL